MVKELSNTVLRDTLRPNGLKETSVIFTSICIGTVLIKEGYLGVRKVTTSVTWSASYKFDYTQLPKICHNMYK